MTRLILPCAGYGKRMFMQSNQSKELLLYNGQPLIERHLVEARANNLNPLVITRIEKQDLIEYCAKNGVETKIIEVEGEWAESVLKSCLKWEENNILVLPDTIIEPYSESLKQIKKGLEVGNDAVFALHKVADPKNWGIVKEYRVVEKPSYLEGEQLAWGMIGFKQIYGIELFNGMKNKNCPLKLRNAGFVYLDKFQDVTRTGKLNNNL